MSFTRSKAALPVAVLFSLTLGLWATAALGKDDSPIASSGKTRILFDCTRYLGRAIVRNFSFRALVNPKTVSVVKIDPLTVRSKEAAIAAGIDRVIHVLPIQPLATAGYGIRPVGGLASVLHFGVTPAQRNRIRAHLEVHIEDIRMLLKEFEPGGESPHAGTFEYYSSFLKDALKAQSYLDRPPRITAAKKAAPDWWQNGKKEGDQHEVFGQAEKWVNWLFGRNSRPAKLMGDVKKLVIAPTKSISGKNGKIVAYWGDELLSDSVLYADSIDFYSRLRQLDTPGPLGVGDQSLEAYLSDGLSTVNVWAVALESTGGDVSRAMKVISVFGHDDQAQHFVQKNVYLGLLDFLVPSQGSFLYRNGAIDGMKISHALDQKFKNLKAEANELMDRYPGSKHEIQSASFRAGNYHFIGGAMMVHELLRKGNDHYLGVNLPAVAAEAAGKAYKRLTMEARYMSDEERLLFDRFYPIIDVAKPEGWSDELFDFTRLKVRLHLAHLELTHEQHLKGARWAYDLLRIHGVTRYSTAKLVARP